MKWALITKTEMKYCPGDWPTKLWLKAMDFLPLTHSMTRWLTSVLFIINCANEQKLRSQRWHKNMHYFPVTDSVEDMFFSREKEEEEEECINEYQGGKKTFFEESCKPKQIPFSRCLATTSPFCASFSEKANLMYPQSEHGKPKKRTKLNEGWWDGWEGRKVDGTPTFRVPSFLPLPVEFFIFLSSCHHCVRLLVFASLHVLHTLRTHEFEGLNKVLAPSGLRATKKNPLLPKVHRVGTYF